MKSTIAIAALVAGANALVGRSDSCCFQLTASGGETGTLGQLTDGQVRLGDTTLSAAEFCISNSIITDSEGRGCVVTSETTQFQCDEGRHRHLWLLLGFFRSAELRQQLFLHRLPDW
ncbi:hypothetical protein N7494_005012 [Penicillium frequentans]|uniref:Cyanovirin-N domain-containing protein n=1 Tax=Penicillium frequentans TaxID=3151616 RepID=A0AAD6D203_9EURO|nr:hypothetical protein N7494_005012 [Penicillium glabrum]